MRGYLVLTGPQHSLPVVSEDLPLLFTIATGDEDTLVKPIGVIMD
jgi:hypothetical protein